MKICLILFGTLMITVPAKAGDPLKAVDSVDLARYCGVWYEIARLPNSFQKSCVGDVSATYALLEDGDIRIVNKCRTKDGGTKIAEGKAKLADEDGPASKLKVRFAPAFLSFLPFVWGDYWIIELAPDYSYAVVGEPDREYLWILSRKPQMDDSLYTGLLERIGEQGYDVSKIVRTVQDSR